MKQYCPSRHGDLQKCPTSAIQNAIDAAYEAGGGVVPLPPEHLFIGGLVIRSRVILEGQGEASSILQLEEGCDTHVIQTENFDEVAAAGKTWLVRDGMPHGFGFYKFRVLGNRKNTGENASLEEEADDKQNGISVYGKRYTLDDVLIANCRGKGMVSQGPDLGGQVDLDDVLEVNIGRIRVHHCSDGLFYKGCHDGSIQSAIIGSCSGTGFLSDTKKGSYNGSVDIGRIHSYGNLVGVRINTMGTAVQRLIGDACHKQGVIIDAHRVQIGQLWAFRNWRTDQTKEFRSTDPRIDASVELNQACQVGTATVRTDFGGTGIRIKGSRTQIGSCQIENESPRHDNPIPGIGIDVQATRVRASGDVQGYSTEDGIGVRVSGEKYLTMTDLNFTTSNCGVGFVNECNGDSQHWHIVTNAEKNQLGFQNNAKITRSTVSIMSRNSDWKSLFMRPDQKTE